MDTKMTAAQYEVACYIEDLCSFVRQYAPAFLKPFFASYSFNEGTAAHPEYACITIWATSVVSEQEAA